VLEIIGIMGISKFSRAAHGEEELVKFDKSIDARSARIASGFCE
jgi:hypothetical protein